MTRQRVTEGPYDLVVIGAGITGVQIAREAALRGRSVLLVDQGDYGSGTSSATTKYIHGGIRYLEQYDVAVVRESLRERRIVALAAPHLVRRTRFLLPVWSWSQPGRWQLTAGAMLYDALSYDRNRSAPSGLRLGRSRWLGRAAAQRAVPWLNPAELRGAVAITEVLNVHPERLLLEFVRDAIGLGVVARNHTAVTGFSVESSGVGAAAGSVRVGGVELTDRLDGEVQHVVAAAVVNAAGPWMGAVLERLVPATGRRVGPSVAPSKGVHVLTRPGASAAVGLVNDAVMARARNGRHVVVSPWMGRELIGPTDTPVATAPDDVVADGDDVAAVLEIANSCRAPGMQLTIDDVDDVTVGIRPLVADGGDDTYTVSRRHHVFDHAADGVAGLWSVAGGKWTTGRAVAEDVVDHLDGASGPPPGRSPSPSRRRPVPGATSWAAEPGVVFEQARRHRPEVRLPVGVRDHLARLYGTRAPSVIDLVASDPSLGTRMSARPGCLDIGAQVVVAVVDEDAHTLADIVDRRLVLGTLGPVTLDELERVAGIAAPLLAWPDDAATTAAAEHARRRSRRALWSPR